MDRIMAQHSHPVAARLDRWAIWLSAACVAHCLATTVAVAALAAAGGVLGNPLIHQVGLVAAMLLGALAFGRGLLTHRRPLPIVLGVIGLALMAGAVAMPHGEHHITESVLTIVGVAVLAGAHNLNRRALA
jgi:hypothetical protein